jgi:hypothetical protein
MLPHVALAILALNDAPTVLRLVLRHRLRNQRHPVCVCHRIISR